MKTFKSLSFIAIFSLITFSCSKDNKEVANDVEVHVVDEHEMTGGEKLNVEVVNEIDPICGMETATHLKDTADYKGKTYGFCSTMCKEKFLENPTQYVNE